ncbi:helix-turn-helix transcriptional regulator [Enorma phocaeensis]|uniref:Helix-turn-helix domain-containing protein n=1 Tax=Enorma phocaeensis TaxID=1871019 RepID=A0A921LUG1_9ACTN|nr:helix-turn-helix transcriptional regulator [Enorma phocaeensis]HJG36770.1 helix-turn-helix domain-containing protein [Enorma phocaeensis]
MEIGHRIKSYRSQLGMSQDALAERVYVSRQTISSWENDKTYPDVQSLLILSEVFGTTIDDLVKGDVEAMTKTLDSDAKTMLRLGYVMLAFLLLMILALVWVSVQLIVWDWPTEQAVPTFVLALVLWGIAMFAAVWAERLKKEHDLVTYQEVLSFMTGKDVDRSTEKGRRERLIPTWMKVIRTVGTTLIAAAIGAFVGYNGAALMDLLLG